MKWHVPNACTWGASSSNSQTICIVAISAHSAIEPYFRQCAGVAQMGDPLYLSATYIEYATFLSIEDLYSEHDEKNESFIPTI